jgi:NADH-quinone oxidoreductase subunit M
MPLVLACSAVAGVVLGALYMLNFAGRFLFGPAKAPHAVPVDLDARERTILAAIVVAIFALGLFPADAMRKTELASREYQALASTSRVGMATAAGARPALVDARAAVPVPGATP